MPTSRTSFLSEIIDERAIIPEEKMAYFRERLKHKLYDFIVSGFLEKEKNHRLSRSELARRIHKSREQITRWLASPGNWEIDTISDLTLGIFGGEPDDFSVSAFTEKPVRNSDQIALLDASSSSTFITVSSVDKTSIPSTSTSSIPTTENRFKIGENIHAV